MKWYKKPQHQTQSTGMGVGGCSEMALLLGGRRAFRRCGSKEHRVGWVILPSLPSWVDSQDAHEKCVCLWYVCASPSGRLEHPGLGQVNDGQLLHVLLFIYLF